MRSKEILWLNVLRLDKLCMSFCPKQADRPTDLRLHMMAATAHEGQAKAGIGQRWCWIRPAELCGDAGVDGAAERDERCELVSDKRASADLALHHLALCPLSTLALARLKNSYKALMEGHVGALRSVRDFWRHLARRDVRFADLTKARGDWTPVCLQLLFF